MASQKKDPKLSGKRIVLGLTGSIALYRSCDLVRDLRELGADVTCVMSKSAEQFVTPMTFHALSGNPVYSNPFDDQKDWAVLHTTLADQADLIAVCPATANAIARLANGMADDLVTSVILASRAKILIVPAMNDNMYAHSLTQANLKKLSQIGYSVMNAEEGELVCGRKGLGHIPSNESILNRIQSLLTK